MASEVSFFFLFFLSFFGTDEREIAGPKYDYSYGIIEKLPLDLDWLLSVLVVCGLKDSTGMGSKI